MLFIIVAYIEVLRRPWEPVIFSFAIDRLVKSCGKYHRLPRAYCELYCEEADEVCIGEVHTLQRRAGSKVGKGGDDFLERLASLSKWKKVIPALSHRLVCRII